MGRHSKYGHAKPDPPASKVAPMLRMMDSVEVIASIIDGDIRKILNEIAETPLPDYAADTETEESEEGGEA